MFGFFGLTRINITTCLQGMLASLQLSFFVCFFQVVNIFPFRNKNSLFEVGHLNLKEIFEYPKVLSLKLYN